MTKRHINGNKIEKNVEPGDRKSLHVQLRFFIVS